MKIKGTDSIGWLGIGVLAGTAALSSLSLISACLLQPSFGWNPAVISLMASSTGASVVGGGIGYALTQRAEDLDLKDRLAFKRLRSLYSKEENNL